MKRCARLVIVSSRRQDCSARQVKPPNRPPRGSPRRGAHPFGPGRTESGGDGISAGHALSLAAHACRRSCRTSARDMIMRAFVLASFIKAKAGNGERIGIMLPASAAAVLVWLGALMAGKTPVMCNWTSGAANFLTALKRQACAASSLRPACWTGFPGKGSRRRTCRCLGGA
ncbi:MAG: hypothetical protein ACLSAH_14025 [Bilophila wadsworthia]